MNKNINDPNQPQSTNKKDSSVSHKIGDAIESAGQKISEKGMPGLGKKIHDAGDKIEHSQEDKDRSRDV